MDHVQKMAPGSFIVRDSQSVGGGYAITIKISEEEARRRKKLPEGVWAGEEEGRLHGHLLGAGAGEEVGGWGGGAGEEGYSSRPFTTGTAVTADMCVSHFLIQPDPAGVKLQGWNEPPFRKISGGWEGGRKGGIKWWVGYIIFDGHEKEHV